MSVGADAATLRAIAEFTRSGGFLGAIGLEPDGVPICFYRDLLAHLAARHEFRSVLPRHEEIRSRRGRFM